MFFTYFNSISTLKAEIDLNQLYGGCMNKMIKKLVIINYSEEDNKKVDLFIGKSNWREPFIKMDVGRNEFISYLAKVYDENMSQLGYKVKSEGLKPRVDADEYNLALYYLAFYSKHDLGNWFFKEIQKYHIPQQLLF